VPEKNILSIEGAGKALNDGSTTSNPSGVVTMLSKTQVGGDRARRLSTRTIPTIGPLGFALHSPPWRNDVLCPNGDRRPWSFVRIEKLYSPGKTDSNNMKRRKEKRK